MQVRASLVAHCQAPELVQPRQGALEYSAVPSQRLDAVVAVCAAQRDAEWRPLDVGDA